MSDNNEPKMTTEEIVDKVLGGGEQQVASSPQTEQTVEAPASTGEVHKTQEQVQKPETDKGFANHPAWQEREAKLKETREQLEQERATAKRYASLLDELQKKQSAASSQPKEQQAQSIAEKACQKLGWNISKLNEEQRAYIQDHVELTMAAVTDYVGEELDKRLGPMEQARQRWEAEQAMKSAESRWATLSSEDGLDPKVVQEAINRFCVDLDKTDPERKQQFSDEDLYFRATRQLLRERDNTKVRQEARDGVKVNARPLGKAPATPVASEGGKKPPLHEFLGAQLDARGVR